MINQNVFAYSFFNGKYEVKEGIVCSMQRNSELSFFRSDKEDIIVKTKPGVMFDGIVWFKERNDHEARRLLMENEHQIIHRLEEKLKEHHGKLKTLVYMVEESLKET